MAADTFLIKRGTTAAVNAYLPAQGEPVYDITLKQLKIGDGVTMGGVPPGNASTAEKLVTPRNITLTGTVTGSTSFDGSANVTISTAVSSALASMFDAKADLASPSFTGVPVGPTATANTNTTQLATTAFVVGQAASSAPVANGTAAIGTSLRYARQDHVHPIDTTRAPLASPAFTGTPSAPTAAVGTNTTQLSTMAALQQAIAAYATATGWGTDVALNLTDPNANRVGGVYQTISGVATAIGLPIAVGHIITHVVGQASSGAAHTQEAYPITSVAANRNRVFRRHLWGGVWTGWQELVYTDNPTLTGIPLSTTPAVGTNTTQIATAAMVQAEIANKRAWTAYTPTLTAASGTFTSASATGKYMVAFGICHWQAVVTITTKGTGANPIISLPFPALAGSVSMPIPAHDATGFGKSGIARINSGLTSATILGSDALDLAADGATISINGSYPIT